MFGPVREYCQPIHLLTNFPIEVLFLLFGASADRNRADVVMPVRLSALVDFAIWNGRSVGTGPNGDLDPASVSATICTSLRLPHLNGVLANNHPGLTADVL